MVVNRRSCLIIVFFLYAIVSSAFAQGTLTYQPIPSGPYGKGSSIAVLFKPNGGFPIGSRFNLLLSDDQGNFTSSSPRIGTIKSHYTTYINGVIPSNAIASNAYRLRIDIIDSNSVVIFSQIIPSLTITIQNALGTNGDASGNFLVPASSPVGETTFLRSDSLKYYSFGACLATSSKIYLNNKTSLNVVWTSKNEFDFTNIVPGPSFAVDPVATTGTITANASFQIPNNLQKVHYRFFQQVTDPSNSNTISTKAFYFINNNLSSPFSVVSNTICYEVGQSGAFAFKVDIDSTREGSTFFNFPAATYTTRWDDGSPIERFSVQSIITSNGILNHNYSKSSCGENVDKGGGQITYNSFGPSMLATHVSACNVNPVEVITPVQIFPKPKVSFSSPEKACVGTTVNFNNTSDLGLQGSTTSPGCTAPTITYEWYVDNVKVATSTNYSTNGLTVGTHTVVLNPIIPNNVVLTCTPEAFTRTICIESVPPNTAKFAFISASNTRYQDTSFCPSNSPFLAVNQSGTLSTGNFCSPLNYNWQLTGPAGFTAVTKTATSADPNFTVPSLTIPGLYTLTLNISNPCGVSATYTQRITVNQLPSITTQPTDKSVCEGANTFFNLVASGTGLNYVWKVSTDGGAVYTTISNGGVYSGATTNRLDITGATLSMNGYKYKVEVSGACPPVVASSVVTLTVYPIPDFTSTLTPNAVCSGSPFNYTPTSSVAGATFSWSRTAVVGISTPAATGNGSINETLTNTTAAPINVTYEYTVSANGCTNPSKFNVIVSIKPKPTLTSTLNPSAICSGSSFSYNPTSATTGTSFSWTRASVAGISNASSSGTGSISESLINTSTAPIDVVYVYTLTAAGCSHVQNVTVRVNPTPVLSSPSSSAAICSGATFSYTATSSTTGATLSWTRAAIAGINSNASGSGTGNISEVLTNSTANPITVTYEYTVSANGCTNPNSFSTTVVVNPKPVLSSSTSASDICSASTFTYSPTSATAGTTIAWIRNAISGINSNIGGSGNSNISETLTNSTASPITVTYVFTLSANGCTNTQSISFKVNPNPSLTSSLNPAAICSGTTFNYTPTSATAGTTYSWSRAIVNGITNSAANSTGSISESLINSTSAPIDVVYEFTLSANGCSRTQNVTVRVNPIPDLTSTLAPADICSGSPFTYTPTSSVTGATFSWSRALVAGINNAAANGNAVINETLTNNTSSAVNVTYSISVSANGCSSANNYSVVVKIKPKPILNSSANPSAICSGATFNYTPSSATTGTIFSWSRASIAGISNSAGSGTGNINETLTNTTSAPIDVVYIYSLTADGCTNTQNVTVRVNPVPVFTSSLNPSPICSGNVFLYSALSSTSGATFSWTRLAIAGINNNSVGSGVGSINETLTNNTTSPITVSYEYTVSANGCTNSSTYTVNVIVYPKPVLTSGLSPAAICSETVFSYSPTSATSNTSFTWSRAAIVGINSNTSGSGTGDISEILTNSTVNPIDVTYVVTSTANGCSNNQNVIVKVNPKPVLSTSLNPAALCSGGVFNYAPTSATSGVSFSWSRSAVTGISNVSASGSGSISETLVNTTTAPIDVVYIFTLTANGCSNSQNVTVRVNPTPVLTSTQSPASICSESSFVYTPTSSTTGASFTWSRAAVVGITNASATGSGSISEALTNSTNAPVNVTYIYTVSANNCTNATTYSVVVTVKPKPTLTSTLNPAAICSGASFGYTPTSGTSGTTFSWSRASVTGISNANSSGSGSINEILTNTTTAPINVVYVYVLTSDGCTNSQNVIVRVNPIPVVSSSISSTAICSGATFTYTATSSTSGASFTWSRAAISGINNNASGSGSGNINEVLTNSTTDPITVTYQYTISANGCANPSTFNTTVVVNPIPVLSSSLNPNPICSGGTFNYTPTSTTANASFTWVRATVSGISQPGTTGSGNISEVLTNTTSSPIDVTYTYTVSANQCVNSSTYSVIVRVQPKPRLSSTLTPSAICSGSTFSYTPTSNTNSVTFTWSRSSVLGISNSAASGTGNINETLTNTTTDPIDVTYVFTMTINGCTNSENVVVRVNPIPLFTGNLSPNPVCSGRPFTYNPASSTAGATFGWTRAVVAGISNPAGTGSGSINETLINTTATPVDVTYIYTTSANGCTNANTTSLVVRVLPQPRLSSTLTPSGICSGSSFTYTATSATTGVNFTWTRSAISGINNNLSGSGSGDISEVLTNSTVNPIDVTYVYTLTANGCSYTENVVVRVNPIPQLSSTLTPSAICSGTTFSYTAASATSGVTYTWSRSLVNGITNSAASQNSGIINEVLLNTTANPLDVTYVFTINANGCSKTQNVVVRVNPIPELSSTLTPSSICSGASFVYNPISNTAGSVFNWSRTAVTGISNAARSNVAGSVSEILTNTTSSPIDVTYIFTISANGCSNTQNVVVRVNPKPVLSSTQNPSAICSGETFAYNPTSATSGVTFTWSRSAVTGISNAQASGSGAVSEALVNTTADPITVTYIYTLTANGCSFVQNVSVVVNPIPVLTSTLTPSPLCNITAFRYTPTSSTSGATFAWTRAAVSGISNQASSGTGAINETLINTTTDPLDVSYVYAVTANGCTNPNSFTVVVRINPTPKLSSSQTPNAICSGNTFNYTPTSLTSGSAFVWTRSSVSGINNGVSSSGTGQISEVLTNNTPSPIDVTYNYTITANGCSNTQTVTLRVNPIPQLSSTLTPSGICSGSAFSYTPTSQTQNVIFAWSRAAVNGISNPSSSGTGNINEILTNSTTEPINVTYTVTLTANGCSNTQNVVVRVSPIPTITSSLTPPDICSENQFSYSVTSGTTNVQFTWARSLVTGISNAAGNGTGNINEILTNTTASPLDVIYLYTLTANGCTNTQNVIVRVNPKPILSSTLIPPAVCSETTFNYTATSATAGVSFSWSRRIVTGISNAAATGGSIINETLVNTTPNPINVTYEFTMTANGCTNKQNVVVRVNPKPILTTPLVLQPQCSGTNVAYVPSSATAGATFTWVRNSLTGISNPPANGSGALNENLVNTTGNPIEVAYLYTITANGCSNTQRVSIIIDPLPIADFVKGSLVSCGPLTKSFENISTVNGSPLTNGSFRWDIYKDGVTNPILTLPSVTYTDRLDFQFTNTGVVDSVYEVVLTAISPNGCVNTTKQKFTIRPDARAYFEVVKNVACANFDVMANNNVAATAYTFANNQTTYRWTIMDKNRQVIKAATSFTPPSHIMTNDDDTNYIKLEVDSRWGCRSSSYEQMVRTFENPTVNFTVNVNQGCTPLSTTVSNNSYLGPTKNISTLTYRWLLNGTFASGNRNDILSLRNNYFTKDSLVAIKLIVSENTNGCKDSLTVGPVTVFPKPSPKFLILKNDPECAVFGGIERSIDDLSVYKMNPPATTKYLWSAQYQSGQGAASVIIDSTDLKKPKFRFPDNKSFFDTVYTLKLKLISVDRCEDSITNVIKVYKRPNVQFTLPIDTSCGANSVFPLDFTNNFAEDSLIRTWSVSPAGVVISDPTAKSPELVFPVNKTDNVIVYTIRQSVKSKVGCEDVLSRNFSVYPLPLAKFTSGNSDKRDSCGPWTKTFHNQSNPKNGGSLSDLRVLFKWTIIKDGKQIFATANETTRNRLTYVFTNTGVVDSVYTVKLWIQNMHGCLDSMSTNYIVHPNPKAFFDGDTTGCAPFNLRTHLKVKDFAFANDLYGYEWRIYDRFGFLLSRRDSIDVPDYTMMAEGDTIRLQLIAKSPYGCRNDIFDRIIITQPKSVKADFSVSSSSYCADATVKFINKSYLGTPDQTNGLNYKWFMNGNLIGTNRDTTLVLPNVSHVKDTTYNFKLFVNYSIYGCTDSFPASVTVKPRPKVIMSVSGTDTCGSPVGITKEIKDQSLIKPGAILKTWSLINEITGKKLGLPFPVNGASSNYNLKFGDNKGDIDSVYTLGLRLQSVDGCVSDTSYKIILFRRPDVRFGFDKPIVCGQEMVLVKDSTKNVEHTKKWSYETFLGDPIQIITPSSKNPSIIIPSNTRNNEVYYFVKQVATTVNGCVDSAAATLTARPIPIAKFKPERDTSCSGILDTKFIDLSYTQTPGTSITKWSWKFDNGQVDTVSRNPSHKFTLPGRYNVSLVVRDNQGCASDPFVSPVTVYGAPVTSFVFPKSDQHCIIDTLKPISSTIFGFGSTKVTSYRWDFGDPTQDVNELNKEFPRHIYTKPGAYRVKLSITTDSSCVVASFEDSVYIVGKPKAGFYTVNSCVGVPVNFVDTSKPGLYDKIGRYYWDFGDGRTSTDRNPSHIYLKSGTYNVTQVVFGNYCVAQRDTTSPPLKLRVYDKRKDSTYPRLHLPYNTPVVICADPGHVSYTWSPRGDLDFANIPCPEIKVTRESLVYNIRIVDTSGCIINDRQEVWGFPNSDVFLPRAFIPNNPVMTENKILKPVYVGIKELKSFRVFDRFGHMVFSTNDMAMFWDGTTNNGKLSPTETYSWIIVAIDTQGKQVIKKGNVTLIRN